MNLDALVREKRELEATLEAHPELKSHRTFKAVERRLQEVKGKIKDHYRQEYYKKLSGD